MSVRELVKDARCKIEAWRIHYNRSRPYSALGWMTPSEFTEKSVVTRIYSQIRFLLI
ncbi:integrase core domain-containing protein, partial [Serratia marcescens]|uniref:integrase core domain-containing protein n=4 Tax=Serratia TaxID=613 RepID=UPI00356B7508